MNTSKVTVKNPCHMKWNELTPIKNSKDRHCNECSWLIKDFKNMSNDEILSYLKEKKGEKVCCAMRSDEQKLNNVQKMVKSWQANIKSGVAEGYLKILLLSLVGLLMFATGCTNDNDTIGVIVPNEEEDSKINKTEIPNKKTLSNFSENN